MLGVLITLLFSVGAACFGHLLVRKLTPSLDVALRIGVSGLVGLGAIGTLTLFVGLAPGGLGSAGVWLVVLVVLAALALAVRSREYKVPLQKPEGVELLFLLGIAVAVLFALVSMLAPSDIIEWDSLAYHLAVPKMWLRDGSIHYISFIHQSNFPGAVDYLYIWGLLWGGQAGAKAFTLAFHLFGLLAVFGFARQMYGQRAGWWAALAWATVPAVLWLSGTAYIDVQNGLYAGLGILFAGLFVRDRLSSCAWLSGIMLGFAAGSKYTGLQTIFAVGVVVAVGLVLSLRVGGSAGAGMPSPNPSRSVRGGGVAGLAVLCGAALLVAAPWYVKNVAWTGNPVFPFFYKQLGGKNWSDWQAAIYQNEQQSFGAGRASPQEGQDYALGKIEPQRLGHAILGLAYQPGRYINPAQTSGQGFPIGAIGVAVIATLLIWLISGRAGPFESSVLGVVLLSLAMWFVLSEQSRYIIALAVPLSVLLGGAVVRLRAGPMLAGVAVVQALVSFYVVKSQRFDAQIQVVMGKVSADEYLAQTTPFSTMALDINKLAHKVALYDEVFGYLLDVPYMWANPGHTSEFGYEKLNSGDELVARLKEVGFSHVYVNFSSSKGDPRFERWMATIGLGGPALPFSAEERAPLMADLNWRVKVLLGEAVAGQRLVPVAQGKQGVLFEVR